MITQRLLQGRARQEVVIVVLEITEVTGRTAAVSRRQTSAHRRPCWSVATIRR